MIVIRIDLFFWHMHNSSFHPYCFYIEPIYVSLALFVYHTYAITYRKQSLIPFSYLPKTGKHSVFYKYDFLGVDLLIIFSRLQFQK